MTTLNLNPKKGSPYMRKVEARTPDSVMLKLMNQYGDDDFAFLEEEYIKVVAADKSLTRACIRAQAARDRENILRLRSRSSTATYDERKQAYAEQSARAEAAATQVKRNWMVEAVRSMTGRQLGELAKKHKGLLTLSKQLRPDEIAGDKFTDAQIKKALR